MQNSENKMIKLNETGVVFNADTHTYSIVKEDGRPLIFPRSVTGILSDNLFPKKYGSVNKAVLQQAAERGTRIHREVELAERMGIYMESEEAKAVIEMREAAGYEWVDSEYIVSDGEYVAGSIDLIWESKKAKGSVALTDMKFTYDYDEEYVTWQLSIYAYLFEKQNPGLKVDRLFCCWAKKKKVSGVEKFFHECYELKRKPVAEVVALIERDKHRDEPSAVVVAQETSPALLSGSAIDDFILLKEKAEEAKAAYEEVVSKLKAKMRDAGIKTFDSEKLRITYSPLTERKETVSEFDENAFRRDHAELYAKYVRSVEKTKKSYEKLTVTVRL